MPWFEAYLKTGEVKTGELVDDDDFGSLQDVQKQIADAEAEGIYFVLPKLRQMHCFVFIIFSINVGVDRQLMPQESTPADEPNKAQGPPEDGKRNTAEEAEFEAWLQSDAAEEAFGVLAGEIPGAGSSGKHI